MSHYYDLAFGVMLKALSSSSNQLFVDVNETASFTAHVKHPPVIFPQFHIQWKQKRENVAIWCDLKPRTPVLPSAGIRKTDKVGKMGESTLGSQQEP